MNIYEELWRHCKTAYTEPVSVKQLALQYDNIDNDSYYSYYWNGKDFFYIVKCKDKFIIPFRGTDGILESWVSNLKFIHSEPKFGIHGAWYRDWLDLKFPLIDNINLIEFLYNTELPIYITAHSRGAIFAQLLCRMLNRRGIKNKCIVFGAPRVGGSKFLTDMALEQCNVTRVVNGYDIADIYPFKMFGYKHYGKRLWYKKHWIRRFFPSKRISDHIHYERIVYKL